MVIIFRSKKARGFLLVWGEVFTFRHIKRNMSDGNDWMTDRRTGKKICDVFVTFVKKISVSELTGQYLKYSGFESTEEWQEEIKQLLKGYLPDSGFLYRVRKR